jgi:actin-like ATPase involved in cell morphogenesis
MKKSTDKVVQLDPPIAAAIRAGLPVEKPQGSFLVDIGSKTTCAAVISLGGIVRKRSINIGTMHMDASKNVPQLKAILDCVRAVLSVTPPELCADIYDYGICISGSGARIKGIAEYFTQETGLRAYIAHYNKERVI